MTAETINRLAPMFVVMRYRAPEFSIAYKTRVLSWALMTARNQQARDPEALYWIAQAGAPAHREEAAAC